MAAILSPVLEGDIWRVRMAWPNGIVHWERLMPVVCPICKSLAQQLLGTGYATAFRCVIHNNFKVSDTVSERAEEYTREQWEIALRKAKQRATPGQWPVIRRGDF